MTIIPLGCTRCDHCATVSAPYEHWPSCRSCAETTCPRCTVPNSFSDDDEREDGSPVSTVECIWCLRVEGVERAIRRVLRAPSASARRQAERDVMILARLLWREGTRAHDRPPLSRGAVPETGGTTEPSRSAYLPGAWTGD